VHYVPDWEPLANALKRVLSTGSREPEAKANICNAVADRKIAVRVSVDKSESDVGGQTLYAPNVEVPPRLKPGDFDWGSSRPVAPWLIGPHSVVEHYLPTWNWKPRKIDLIELSTADIASTLCDRETSTVEGGLRNPRIRTPDNGRSHESVDDAVRSPSEIAPSARPKDDDKKAVPSPLSPSGASAQSYRPRKRGRKPTVRETVVAKMRSEISAKLITKEQLEEMLEKTLAEKFGVSRDTVRKSRNEVLRET